PLSHRVHRGAHRHDQRDVLAALRRAARELLSRGRAALRFSRARAGRPASVLLFAFPSLVRHARYPDFPAVYRILALLALFLPMIVLANWGEASYLPFDDWAIEAIYQILGFAGTAAAICLGVRRQWPHVVNTAVTLFIALLYTKFFDWWWEAMPKYLFFLVLGLTAVLFLLVLRRLRTALQQGTPG